MKTTPLIEPRFEDRGAEIRQKFKPDFHDYWPRFTQADLLERSAYFDISVATHLRPAHLLQLAQLDTRKVKLWLRDWRRLSVNKKQFELHSILKKNGFNSTIAEAISNVNREDFAAEYLKDLAYFNVSVPYMKGSTMTMWGLSAILLEALHKEAPARIIEVGFGAGGQAMAVLNLINVEAYIGYELCAPLIHKWLDIKCHYNKSKLISVFEKSFLPESHNFREGDLLLFSTSPDRLTREFLYSRLPLGVTTFFTEPVDEYFFDTYLSNKIKKNEHDYVVKFSDYIKNTHSYMRLVKLHNNGKIAKEIICYNVQFIQQEYEVYSIRPNVVNSTLDKLLMLINSNA